MPHLVRDVMETAVYSVTANVSLRDPEHAFLRERVGAVPVLTRDGDLEGIVSRSDVVRQLSLEQSLAEVAGDALREQSDEHWAEASIQAIGAAVGHRITSLRAGDIMIREVFTTEPDEPLERAADRLLEHRIHRLPVLEKGRLVGMLSSLDFVALFASGRAEDATDGG
jgi:CBS domain-containing protein